MNKKDLRKLFKLKRNLISKFELKSISEVILDKIITLKISGKKISLFLPIENQNEIDTFPILKKLEISNHISASKSDFSTFNMKHFRITSDSTFTLNEFGIPEPLEDEQITENEFDIVFVPLLAIDKYGNRVGYGKGFYDRFLSKCNPNCQFIGISLFDDLVEIDDISEEDVKLNICITPNNIYHFE
jgi:5-formyltetrahydrofolate cyclo-ligase